MVCSHVRTRTDDDDKRRVRLIVSYVIGLKYDFQGIHRYTMRLRLRVRHMNKACPSARKSRKNRHHLSAVASWPANYVVQRANNGHKWYGGGVVQGLVINFHSFTLPIVQRTTKMHLRIPTNQLTLNELKPAYFDRLETFVLSANVKFCQACACGFAHSSVFGRNISHKNPIVVGEEHRHEQSHTHTN